MKKFSVLKKPQYRIEWGANRFFFSLSLCYPFRLSFSSLLFHSLTQCAALLLVTKGLGEVQSCGSSLSNTHSLDWGQPPFLPVGVFYLGWQQHVESHGLAQRRVCVCPSLDKLGCCQRSFKWATFNRPFQIWPSRWSKLFKWVTHTKLFKVRSNPFKKVRKFDPLLERATGEVSL